MEAAHDATAGMVMPLTAAAAFAPALGPALLLAGLLALPGCSGSGGASASATAASQLGTAAGMVRLGDDVRRQGDLDGALTIYQAASSRDGRNVAALERIGAASITLGEPLRAEQAFRAIMALGTASAEVRYGLGIALLAQHRISEALPILAALGQGSSDLRLLRVYAVALDMSGRSAEAQASYRRGLALAPADSSLHGDLALSLAASGDITAALAESAAAMAAVVPDPRQQANNVLLLAISGQEDEARRRGTDLLGRDRTEAVLQRAALVRQAPDAASRAIALGVLTQPPS